MRSGIVTAGAGRHQALGAHIIPATPSVDDRWQGPGASCTPPAVVVTLLASNPHRPSTNRQGPTEIIRRLCSPSRSAFLSLACLTVGLLLGPALAEAQEADSVVLRNGDVLHGEVKELSRGKLAFDTDAMDIVSIDWDDILFVTSVEFFEVTDISGQVYYGQVVASDQERLLSVAMETTTLGLPFSEVVAMRSLADGFWSKTSGFVDLGSNLSRANDLRSLLLKGHMSFDGPVWQVDLDAETYYQSQTAKGETEVVEEQTSRNSLTFTGRRFINGRWAVAMSFQGETNEELSLDYRGLASLGPRYNIIRNQGLEFHVGLSAVFNRERFVDAAAEKSGEAKAAVGFDMFDVGDLDVYLFLEGYHALNSSRVRANLNGRVAWEIIDDFTIGLSALERYDSKPGEEAQKRDFQYSLTLGWTWG
jgi:hypothetical protein